MSPVVYAGERFNRRSLFTMVAIPTMPAELNLWVDAVLSTPNPQAALHVCRESAIVCHHSVSKRRIKSVSAHLVAVDTAVIRRLASPRR